MWTTLRNNFFFLLLSALPWSWYKIHTNAIEDDGKKNPEFVVCLQGCVWYISKEWWYYFGMQNDESCENRENARPKVWGKWNVCFRRRELYPLELAGVWISISYNKIQLWFCILSAPIQISSVYSSIGFFFLLFTDFSPFVIISSAQIYIEIEKPNWGGKNLRTFWWCWEIFYPYPQCVCVWVNFFHWYRYLFQCYLLLFNDITWTIPYEAVHFTIA